MRKRLISREVKLAGVLLLLGVMPSCLLPQEDDPLPDLPPLEDHRPEIILGQVTPPNQVGFTVDIVQGTCLIPDFHVFVKDEDLNDPISSVWRATSLEGAGPGQWFPGAAPSTPGTGARRSDPQIPASTFFTSFPFTTAGRVRIDVIVCDTKFNFTPNGMGFDLGEEPYATLPTDGGVVEEPAGLDSFTWNVNVAPCQ